MGFIKNTLFLAGVAGAGYFGYQMVNKAKEYKADYEKPVVFGGKDEKIKEDFKGASYGLLGSGLNLDLSEATMSVDEAVLQIKGEFCGVSITVPEAWNVKVDGVAEKSGTSIKVDFDEADTTSKRLIVQYDIKYGGLDIHYASSKEAEEVDLDEVVVEG